MLNAPVRHLSLSAATAICLSLAALAASPAHAQQAAGIVKKKEGTVEIVRNGQSLPAAVGSQIQPGDVLRTAKDASVGVMLKDESRMSLGPNSQIALEQFSFNRDTYSGNFLVSVLKGTFAMISGLVVKNNPGSASVRTPTSTAGIRGTTFVVEVP